MNFGEKLFTLRKKEGLSQEALAEKLNTSRQAVSKWENNQGFPETEKILKIGDIFNVSIDYLLKNSNENVKDVSEGYYVSKEMADGFLLNEEKIIKNVAFGMILFVFAYIVYLLFKDNINLCIVVTGTLIVTGAILILKGIMLEDNYKEIKKQTLIFDNETLKHLNNSYKNLKRKSWIEIVGGTLLIVGIVVIFITVKIFELEYIKYKILAALCVSLGMAILIIYTIKIEAYEILIKNDEYVNRFSNKVLNKAKKELDRIFE